MLKLTLMVQGTLDPCTAPTIFSRQQQQPAYQQSHVAANAINKPCSVAQILQGVPLCDPFLSLSRGLLHSDTRNNSTHHFCQGVCCSSFSHQSNSNIASIVVDVVCIMPQEDERDPCGYSVTLCFSGVRCVFTAVPVLPHCKMLSCVTFDPMSR